MGQSIYRITLDCVGSMVVVRMSPHNSCHKCYSIVFAPCDHDNEITQKSPTKVILPQHDLDQSFSHNQH